MTAALAGWPYAEHRVRVGGHEMAYVDEGSGSPVLLVHGNPTWSFYYRALLAALPPLGLRAIAPDHVGMGRSDKPGPQDYPHTLSRRVADFADFVDGLGLTEPVSLVVHDWGGAIALSWAVDNVDRVDRLVVLNTGAFPLPRGKGVPWMLQAARLPVVGDLLIRRLNAFSLGAVVLGTGRPVLPAEARAGLLAPYDGPGARVAVSRFVQDIPVRPSDPAYPVLARTEQRLPLLRDKPALVCWGMKDPVFDAPVLDHLLSLLPQAEQAGQVHRYADAGHFVLEDAADRIVPLVTRFLDPARPAA
ncbi:MAG: alpha/beta fold hydrolase [Actinomycetota bacterium]|nr:alpha/beta fold hydrolase [Actinomycetota bacterium]